MKASDIARRAIGFRKNEGFFLKSTTGHLIKECLILIVNPQWPS
jgi:hypothetical protein